MISKFLKCLKIDFKYMVKSKFIIGFLITLISIVGISSWAQYIVANSECNQYKQAVDIYENNTKIRREQMQNGTDFDIEEFLDQSNEEKETIQIAKHNLIEKLKATSPKYAISSGFENALGFWAIMFFVLGSIVVSKDYKHKILKHIALRGGKTNYILAKIASVILATIATVIAYMLLFKIGNGIVNHLLAKKISGLNIDLGTIKTSYSAFTQFGVMTFLALVFSLMGAGFCTIFKKPVVGIVIATAYIYVIPTKFKYEPDAMMYSIVKKYFDFWSIPDLKLLPMDSNITYSFIFLTMILVGSALIMMLVNKKRSAYK